MAPLQGRRRVTWVENTLYSVTLTCPRVWLAGQLRVCGCCLLEVRRHCPMRSSVLLVPSEPEKFRFRSKGGMR